MNSKTADDMNETLNDKVNANEEFEIAKKAVLDAYANFVEAKKHLKIAAFAAGIELKDSGKEHLEEALLKATERKNELQDSTSEYIKENPLTSAGIAFISGVLFSKFFGK
ncbi:MAG: hypothetical protein V4628_07320 [Pseudomonadota bacterium]